MQIGVIALREGERLTSRRSGRNGVSRFKEPGLGPAALPFSIGACQIPEATLAYIIKTFQNLGDVVTSGLDLQANWTAGATPYGRFSVGLRGTYVINYEFQVEPNGPFLTQLVTIRRSSGTVDR